MTYLEDKEFINFLLESNKIDPFSIPCYRHIWLEAITSIGGLALCNSCYHASLGDINSVYFEDLKWQKIWENWKATE